MYTMYWFIFIYFFASINKIQREDYGSYICEDRLESTAQQKIVIAPPDILFNTIIRGETIAKNHTNVRYQTKWPPNLLLVWPKLIFTILSDSKHHYAFMLEKIALRFYVYLSVNNPYPKDGSHYNWI